MGTFVIAEGIDDFLRTINKSEFLDFSSSHFIFPDDAEIFGNKQL